MAIQMKALRRIYIAEDRKEYEAGKTFSVANQNAADRLVRRHKAEIVNKANRGKADSTPLTKAQESDTAPLDLSSGQYNRRDMRPQE